jgi:hypothetical protein
VYLLIKYSLELKKKTTTRSNQITPDRLLVTYYWANSSGYIGGYCFQIHTQNYFKYFYHRPVNVYLRLCFTRCGSYSLQTPLRNDLISTQMTKKMKMVTYDDIIR